MFSRDHEPLALPLSTSECRGWDKPDSSVSPKSPLDSSQVHYYRNTHMHNGRLPLLVHPSSGVPIYRQIMDQLRALMASGRLKAGDLLPSVRQLSAELEVNMMTVSKAFARLEQDGLVERIRGTGMRVREQQPRGSVADRQEQLRDHGTALVTQGRQLSLTDDQILSAVKSLLREHRP